MAEGWGGAREALLAIAHPVGVNGYTMVGV